VKKEIKQEIKPEIKSEPPYNPTLADKLAHSFFAEMSIWKRPGIVTRTQERALEAPRPVGG
jgi:hypothetical protein